MTITTGRRIDCLDGLRGIAAFWVFVGHGLILTGINLRIASEPDLGVDLFIILSGFLMVYHYQHNEWSQWPSTAKFWARRFFRIAPLYYALLLVALLAGSYIYECRMALDAFRHTTPQAIERYEDVSTKNILIHASFVFGMLPSYAFRTPLPDWSIGLEMQFYFAFPAIMLAIRRCGWLAGMAIVFCISLIIALVARHAGIIFPMPAFLPLKFQIFACGMLCAASLERSGRFAFAAAVTSAALIAVPLGGPHDTEHLLVREAINLCFYSLLLHQRMPAFFHRFFRAPFNFLGSRPFHWAGDVSYSVYLVHLLVLQPVAATVLAQFVGFSNAMRFALTMLIAMPLTYGIASLTFTQIEMRGNLWGARLLKRLGAGREAVMSPAEEIAAP